MDWLVYLVLLPSRSVSSACTSCGLGEVVLSGALFPVTGVIGTAVSLGLLSSGSYWRGWMKPRVFTVVHPGLIAVYPWVSRAVP